jgi:hypothetical protein
VVVVELERAGDGAVERHAFEVGDFLPAEIFALLTR